MPRLCAIGCFVLIFAQTSLATPHPNIVLIMADDMGWGDLSCYPKGAAWGEEAHTPTPNIDAIAAGGVQCMQGYATGMVCAPSRAGLLSGQFQERWGYYGFEDSLAPIPRELKLLPEVLRDAGYATGMIGKWHVSTDPDSLPLRRGFDRFFGFLSGQHDYYYSAVGQTFHGVGYGPDGHVFDQDQPSKGVKYLTEEFTDRAIDFMDGARKADKPFFLYLPYNAPHTPHQVPWADLAPYQKGREGQRPAPRNIVRAMIVNLDRNVGRITNWLRDNGLEQNTIVIFTSDNGGSDGGPGQMIQHNGGLRGRKGTCYEGGVREPYIVRWPARLSPGQKYDHPVSHVDIFATAIAVAGATPKELQQLDGVDLIPYLAGEKEDAPHKDLYWSMQAPKASHWALRDGDLKLIYEDIHPETMSDKKGRVVERRLQLYDLASDPIEAVDLAAARPEDVKRLQAMYDRFISQCKPSLYTPEVEAKHKAALAAREKDPALRDVNIATGSPGHWIGSGAKGRLKDETVAPPLPGRE
ncbi:MAG TPA: sulfatase-like hydrolase/transferase [Tepidisphaeraceae bacterium]|jgi:arylsulfatase A-like enzyme|nr:sulfatase-like hydrolase/transferase [Tepidisphaeraceae bacterium]